MTETNKRHRPLVSGIKIQSVKRVAGNLDTDAGTLTGVATRIGDNQRVLVTNHHVMSGSVLTNITGAEEMYQADFDPQTIYVVSSSNKVGTSVRAVDIDATDPNEVDVAYCEMDSNLTVDFSLHADPHNSSRKIHAGVKAPEAKLNLKMLGATNGEGQVSIMRTGLTMDIDTEVNGVIHTRCFEDVIILDASRRHILDGDSGAPYLYYEEEENKYKMCCIVYARTEVPGRPVGEIGWAFPASKAESKLGIRFGIIPPRADAGSPQRAYRGDQVTIYGQNSWDQVTRDNVTLTYLWEQIEIGDGPTVTLSDASAKNPTFTIPSNAPLGSTLTFKLTVTNPDGGSDTDEVPVHVRKVDRPVDPIAPIEPPSPTPPTPPTNRAPYARAGGDRTVSSGATLQLDGSGSSDPDEGDTITYLWEKVGDNTAPLAIIHLP